MFKPVSITKATVSFPVKLPYLYFLSSGRKSWSILSNPQDGGLDWIEFEYISLEGLRVFKLLCFDSISNSSLLRSAVKNLLDLNNFSPPKVLFDEIVTAVRFKSDSIGSVKFTLLSSSIA